MKRKDFGEIMFSVFLLLLSIFALLYINSGRQATISSAQSFDFATIPTLWALILGALVIVHLVITVISKKNMPVETSAASEKGETDKEKEKIVRLRTLFTFLALVAYVVLLGKINFFILSFGFLFVMFYILGQRKIWLNAAVSVIGGVLLYLILIVGLQLPL